LIVDARLANAGTATVLMRYQGFTILTDPTSCTRATTFTLVTASLPNA